MNKKLTAALIAAGTLPFAAQALELTVDYNPSFGAGEGRIANTVLSATLDTDTGVLALTSERSTPVFGNSFDEIDVLSREASNALVVNLLTGESAFARTTGFDATDLGDPQNPGDDSDDSVLATYAITRTITPAGNGTFDYGSAFSATLSGDNVDFTASSDLAALTGVSTVADIRSQIQTGLAGN